MSGDEQFDEIERMLREQPRQLPPAGLLEKIKEDIPTRFQDRTAAAAGRTRGVSWILMKSAAALFLVTGIGYLAFQGGALDVRKQQSSPVSRVSADRPETPEPESTAVPADGLQDRIGLSPLEKNTSATSQEGAAAPKRRAQTDASQEWREESDRQGTDASVGAIAGGSSSGMRDELSKDELRPQRQAAAQPAVAEPSIAESNSNRKKLEMAEADFSSAPSAPSSVVAAAPPPPAAQPTSPTRANRLAVKAREVGNTAWRTRNLSLKASGGSVKYVRSALGKGRRPDPALVSTDDFVSHFGRTDDSAPLRLAAVVVPEALGGAVHILVSAKGLPTGYEGISIQIRTRGVDLLPVGSGERAAVEPLRDGRWSASALSLARREDGMPASIAGTDVMAVLARSEGEEPAETRVRLGEYSWTPPAWGDAPTHVRRAVLAAELASLLQRPRDAARLEMLKALTRELAGRGEESLNRELLELMNRYGSILLEGPR